MRKISANPSHTEHQHMWGEGGFRMQAWLLPSHTFPRQSIKAPNHSCTHREEGVGETVWQPELEAIALMNGGLIWHRATQSYSQDTNMHISCMHMCRHAISSQKFTHKAVLRAHAVKCSISEKVFWLHKQALDSVFSESCSFNSINLQY